MKKSIKIMAIICGVIAVLVLFSAGRDLLIANGIYFLCLKVKMN